MQILPRNIEIERSSTSHMMIVIGKYPAYLEAMSKAMTIGDGIVNRIV